MRRCKRWMWAFLLCPLSTAVGSRAATIKDSIARECGVDENQPAQRIFADPEGKNVWRRYKKPEDVPTLESSGHFAQFWATSNGNVFIRMEEPSEDWVTYTDYCFNKIGRLIVLRFEVRTYWGYGFRKSDPIVKGIFRPRTSDYFDTENEAAITRPEQGGGLCRGAQAVHLQPRVSIAIRQADIQMIAVTQQVASKTLHPIWPAIRTY
jgi:hypothetical protein